MLWAVGSSLADATIESRTPRLDDPPDGAAAAGPRARLAFPVIDVEAMLEGAGPPLRRGVVAQGRAAGGDGIVEDAADRSHQRLEPLDAVAAAGERRRDALGRQGGAVQRLAGIDIAETGDHALVEQRRFERGLATVETGSQVLGIEVVAQRLRAEPGEELVVRCGRGVDQIHEPEAAGIGVDDAGAVIEQECDVIVNRRAGRVGALAGLFVGLAQGQRPAARRVDGEAAAHAEMHEQALAVIEADQQIFRPPPDGLDAPAGQSAGKTVREGNAQIPRFSSTFSIRRPSRAVSRPRRTVSTSGSSGMTTSWQGFAASSSVFSTDWNVNRARLWSAPMADRPSNRRMAPFGDADVEAAEKQTMVNEVFAKVASKYDQMNDLMSFGLHRLWKDDLVAMLNPPHGARSFEVLDLAGGTGDVAGRIVKAGGAGVRSRSPTSHRPCWPRGGGGSPGSGWLSAAASW